MLPPGQRTPEQANDFLDRLRDTRPFGGVSELVAQLRADVERAREIVQSDRGA